MREGRFFLHEHPIGSSAWQMKEISEMGLEDGVQLTTCDMCAFGMYQEREGVQGFVKKRTGFMTNAKGIALELGKECDRKHSHIHLLNGRAKRAEVYPDELCYRIIVGLLEQMKYDGRIREGQIGAVMPEEERAWDDVTGEELDWKMVQKARTEERQEVD